jgi:hypothetical protein
MRDGQVVEEDVQPALAGGRIARESSPHGMIDAAAIEQAKAGPSGNLDRDIAGIGEFDLDRAGSGLLRGEIKAGW